MEFIYQTSNVLLLEYASYGETLKSVLSCVKHSIQDMRQEAEITNANGSMRHVETLVQELAMNRIPLHARGLLLRDAMWRAKMVC